VFQLLIEAGANLNLINYSGCNVISMYLDSQDVIDAKVVKLILRNGFEIKKLLSAYDLLTI
jgi:hypothetical protein